VENEKGLFIDFEIVSSQVNGGPAALSFGQTIANNLGDIPAHTQTYAQWWLQSSLLGHFTSYNVEATHVTSYGNEDLSLLDQVTIHELIHGFTPVMSDGSTLARAFLVNDEEDAKDLPDQVYFTNATQADVTVAQSTSWNKVGSAYEVTVLPKQGGWTYANMLDPVEGKVKLLSVVRKRDNKELPADNVWQTSRSLRDGLVWKYEHRLHFVGDMPAEGEVFVLTYETRPEVELDFTLSKPEYDPDFVEEGLVTEDVDEVTVTFNKPIQAETFTYEDVVYQVQGQKQNLSQVENFITPKQGTDNAYVIDLSSLNGNLPNGYYVLSVQGAGITDNEGYQGLYGRKVDWVLFRGGLIQLRTMPFPENSGEITYVLVHTNNQMPTPARRAGGNVGQERYGSTIQLTATPEEGYEFVNWTISDVIVSTDPVYETIADGDLNIVANFKKKQFKVDVTTEGNGTVRGSGTGLYEYDTDIEIEAVPDADFILKEWVVDGVTKAAEGNTLQLNIKQGTEVKAVFVRDVFDQTLTLARGWNWMSTYLREQQSLGDMSQYANRLLSQTDELFRDPNIGLVGNIEAIAPGLGYKIEATRTFSQAMRGHLYNTPLSVQKGWNWVAYPYHETKTLAVISNPENGDYIAGQTGFAQFDGSTWEGTLSQLSPGQGYLYKSATTKDIVFNFDGTTAGARRFSPAMTVSSSNTQQVVDIHSYPNTMNFIARIYRDGMELSGQSYSIYALSGQELRGVSQFVGSNYYLTVYGDGPVEISFVVENEETGETFVASEKIQFRSDVVGSRKDPFAFNIGEATGIYQLDGANGPMTIYTLSGQLVSHDATLKTLHRLPKGIYIVNGKKCYVK
jgi:hypothetical protein